jgi:hypothetical protein
LELTGLVVVVLAVHQRLKGAGEGARVDIIGGPREAAIQDAAVDLPQLAPVDLAAQARAQRRARARAQRRGVEGRVALGGVEKTHFASGTNGY